MWLTNGMVLQAQRCVQTWKITQNMSATLKRAQKRWSRYSVASYYLVGAVPAGLTLDSCGALPWIGGAPVARFALTSKACAWLSRFLKLSTTFWSFPWSGTIALLNSNRLLEICKCNKSAVWDTSPFFRSYAKDVPTLIVYTSFRRVYRLCKANMGIIY